MYKRLLACKAFLLIPFLMMLSLAAFAQPKAPSSLSNPLVQMLLVIMVMLALAIGILANVVNSAAGMFRDKIRKEREATKGGMLHTVLLAAGLLFALSGMAQDAAAVAPEAPKLIHGIQPLVFYLMIGTIAVEIIILIGLVYQLKFLIGIETRRKEVAASVAVEKPKEAWWWRINKAASVEQEKDIDLSHDYDGIRELDNKLPPWWIAAFAFTIVFSVVYIYRYHVAHTAPLQIEELAIAMQKAEEAKMAYLAKSASNVDENTVKMLDESGIAAGKQLFAGNCVACHGNAGEGNAVGPNLTDNYWLHGGSLSDIFKTIKYGVVEKGMRSWKEDMTPVQMAQLASFIQSLKGTNPPNAREPQGEEYKEIQGVPTGVTDSTAITSAGS